MVDFTFFVIQMSRRTGHFFGHRKGDDVHYKLAIGLNVDDRVFLPSIRMVNGRKHQRGGLTADTVEIAERSKV